MKDELCMNSSLCEKKRDLQEGWAKHEKRAQIWLYVKCGICMKNGLCKKPGSARKMGFFTKCRLCKKSSRQCKKYGLCKKTGSSTL
jgi:hypothetical protein